MMRRMFCSGVGKSTVSTLYRRIANVQQQGNSRGISIISSGRTFFLQQQQQRNQNQNRIQKSISVPRWWYNDEIFHSNRSFSTSSPNASKGEILYQQALQLMKQAKDIDENREQEKSQMMYEAWKKSQEKELNSKSQGVKVVKTLVKEARKDKTNNDSRDKKIEADELLKQAANNYNHPEAAIQLGNMLLNEASRSINRQNVGSDSKNSVIQAMQLFRQAGEAGSRVGWYNLGHLLWTGFPTTPDNDDEDEQDDNVNISIKVDDTRIVVADMEEAMNAFKKAIDLGDSDAMYLVGVHHLAKEDQENCRYGINLIEQAADAGHGGALYYLALLVSFFPLCMQGRMFDTNIVASGFIVIEN
jgi:TPR repeat protein